eukprot:169013_1
MSTDEIIDEKKVDEDSHNDYQEVIINPGNDRRIIVCDTQNKSDGIIECIGCLEVHYIPDPTINAPELAHGTGTVIHIDNHHCIFVLTAAHNIYANEKECINCKAKTLKKKCSHCKSGNTIKTGKLIKPTDIYFVRRSNDKHTLGESIERYQAENYEVPDKYLTYSLPRDGHDIAFIMFKCHDKDGINLYTEQCKKICLISDTMFGGSSCVSYIYGYPGEFRETKNKRIYYYLYGMGTSKINAKNKFTVATNSKTNKKYIVNECIDTTVGQSGSCIYSYHHNDTNRFLIYGVHTGGSPVQKPKPCNFGTFLDVDTMSWIKNVLIEFGAENMGNINKFIVKESNGQFKPISTSTNKVHNKMFGMDGKNGLLARVVLGKNIVYCAPKPMKMKGNVPKKSKNKYDVKCQLVKDQKALKIVKVFAAFD